MSSPIPATIPVYTPLVDDQDDVLAEHQNIPNDDIAALATLIGMYGTGKTQAWGVDMVSAALNAAPPLCTKKDANTIYVSAGTVWVANAGQSIRLPRRKTTVTELTAADLDTGAMAVGYHYIYATAGSIGTTPTYKISASASAPTGFTEYELIGWFYNEAGGSLDITSGFVGNVKRGNRSVPNGVSITGATDISTASTTYVDMTGMTVYFYSSGRPILISFNAQYLEGAGADPTVLLNVDGSSTKSIYTTADGLEMPMTIINLAKLAAGGHTIKIQWKTASGTVYQNGTQGIRELIAMEL